MGMIQSQ
ncbi:hypothetical protein Pint_03695 [Pistacia integerrima]|nr:hypothetical protein Pint_03695 [Pistacia integerrima]